MAKYNPKAYIMEYKTTIKFLTESGVPYSEIQTNRDYFPSRALANQKKDELLSSFGNDFYDFQIFSNNT